MTQRTSSHALAISASDPESVQPENDGQPHASPFEQKRADAGRQAAHKLVSVLLEQIEQADDPARRVDLLCEVACLYEDKLREPEHAFDALLLAWAEDYSDERTAAWLTRLASRVQGWSELLMVANEALRQDLGPRQRFALYLRCAAWYGSHLGQPESAIACYQHALAIDPGHLEAALSLADLYEASEQWEALLPELERAVHLSTARDVRLRLLLRLAALCNDRLHLTAKAVSFYRKALELDEANATAAEALEHIYRQAECWDDLVALLRGWATNTRDAQVACAVWVRLAQVLQASLHKRDEAIEAYERALACDELNLSALREIEVLYQASERFRSLPVVLERQAQAVGSDRERVQVLIRLALLWEQHFIKPEKAISCLEQARALQRDMPVVLDQLTRLYRQAKRFQDLLAILEERLATTSERAEAIAMHKAIAALCTTDLEDPARAIRAYEALCACDASDVDALRSLIRLYERGGDIQACAGAMERLSRLESDAGVRADLLMRLGRLYLQPLADRAAAVACYERALADDPTRSEISNELCETQLAAGDFQGAARTLRTAIAVARSQRKLSELHLQLARILAEKLGDHDKAAPHLEAASVHDPENAQAALALAETYVRKCDWVRALPLLRRVNERSLAQAPSESADTHGLSLQQRSHAALLLGEVAGWCDDHALSAQAYERAVALDPRDLRAALGAACAHFRLENWSQVQAWYDRVLRGFSSALDAPAKAQALRRRGLALLALGSPREALRVLEGALKVTPGDALTLRALVTLHQDSAEWKKVIKYKMLLSEVVPEEERVRLQCEVAALFRDELGSCRKAIAALRRALETSPSSRILLHELLSSYQRSHRWRDAMSVLETIAQGEERPDLASKYLYTAGVIARDELGDAPRAVELFERALDTDPQRLKAFEAINRLLTQAKEWKRLERAFRKMLHRLTTTPDAQPELLQHLWHSLGVIYRDRMSDFVSAAQAFEQASRFNPDSDTQHCILAELYVRIPGEVQRAIGANLERIDRDATNAAPYRALYEIYRRHLEDDRAWCAAQVLIYLGDVDQELLAFHQRCQQTSRRGGHALTSEDWLRHLYHPDHDRALATIFRCLSEPLHERRYGQSGGSAKKRKKVAASEEALVTTFRSACEVLSTDISPRFVVNALAPHAMRSEGGALPTVTAGRLACERSHRELCFLVGHHLSYYRSEHYIRHLLRSREELGGAFLVAMRSIGKSDGSQDTEQAWAALRRKLAPETIERIQRSCNIFVRRGEPANIKRYIQTTELTACRAGLLLADDLSASMTMVRQLESAGADDLSPNEKALALLKFSISEPYFQLRRRIGVAVSKAGRAWEDGAA